MGSVAASGDRFAKFEKQPIEGRLFINGEFVESKAGKTFDITNPATEKKSASVYEAGVEDVDAAVAAAKAAFPAWAELSAGDRGDYLFKLADALEKRLDEMAYLDAISMGAPAHTSFLNPMALTALRYFAGRAWDTHGDSSLNTPGFVNITLRQPFGVTAGITPWNVPVAMVLFKMAPALITGNTIVIKTSEKSPLAPLIVAKCCQEIGLPKGVFNLINGFGRPTGEALAKHMDVRKISFTGSTLAGRAIKKAAAESNLKNVTLELGGKSPLVIFPDADLSKAVPAAAMSILMNSGQACIASSRVYVHADIADKFTEGMKNAMQEMGKSDDPLTSTTAMRGPQVDKLQFNRIMDFFAYAKEKNLDITIGGDRERDQGFYIAPTIISNAPEDSRVMKEEIFGPVVCINTFTDEDEVLKRANDTEYGLYASLFTRDISRALRVAKKMEAGSVGGKI
ncbi:hypothetical protein PMZ80_008246 [Knufia obscura]|uniref:aldehyde dehydrogenase (NAD(+)) n=1 Tax=Knufia obscura TaxID=1635080 RepID=A0ABR0RID1_9EURO|nr:hypothetical protein PMZ80_008246 [Knufia obscura]